MATTTPNYGWPVPTDTDYVKDGAAAIEALGDAIDATVFGLPSGGLTLISATTIGTAVASVTVSNAFSADYDNYLILLSGGVGTSTGSIRFNLGASTTGYYSATNVYSYSVGTQTITTDNNQAYWSTVGRGSTDYTQITMHINGPFLSHFTTFQAVSISSTGGAAGFCGGLHAVATSYTDFTIDPALGNLTGGVLRVYGYQNS